METQIQSIHFDATEGLQQFVYEKMDKLEKLFDRLEAAMVILRLDKNNKKQNKIAEVSVRMPGAHMFAKDKSETFEKSIVGAIEEIRHQIERHRDKLRKVTPNGKEVVKENVTGSDFI